MDDAMSEAGIVLGVCHHDDGGAFLIQFGKEVHHFLSVLGVEVTRRFVGKDELGVGDYGTGYGYALVLTPRELLRIVLGSVADVHALQHIIRFTLSALR